MGKLKLKSKHRLLCGDSTSESDVARLMDGEKADLCFTSPPYNAGSNNLGGNKKMKKSKYLNDDDNRKNNEWLELISATLNNMQSCTKNQAFNIQQLSGNKIALIDFLYRHKNRYADVAIWYKGGGQPAMQSSVMNSRFEFVFIFSSKDDAKRKIESGDFRNISNVFELNPSGKNQNTEVHAAVFPVELSAHYLGYLSKKSVIDPFMGSGTTLIACEQLDRKCYGMEIDPLYCDVIVKRWENLTGEKAVRNG